MIITLCGSAKFEDEWSKWNKELTLRGHAVFSMCSFPTNNNSEKDWYTEDQKIVLDLVHKLKISHSDCIFVLDVDGYIGHSTKTEIEYARQIGKPVHHLSINPSLGKY